MRRSNVMNCLTRNVEQWAIDRNIHTQDPMRQMVKLQEEVGELAKGLRKAEHEEVMDGIGDCVVVLTILAMQCGTSVSDCLEMAYDEIKDRTGKVINGLYVKSEDLAQEG